MNELMNWDPFRELDAVQDRMTRLLNRSLGGQLWNAPLTDIYEENGKLVVETALPSFQEKDIDVQINQDRLEVKAEHSSDQQSKERNYVRRESTQSSFYRAFALPKDIDVDSAKAKFEDGLLKVTFEKRSLPEPKKLRLESSSKPEQAKLENN